MKLAIATPAALTLAILLGGRVAAEPVYVESGGEVGQGWVTRYQDRCLVISAAHVVRGDRAEIVGPGGRRGSAARIVRHPTLDLALIEIEGALKTDCPTSGLGFDNSMPALTASRGGMRPIAVEMAGSDGSPNVTPVQIDSIDATEPYFTVRSPDPDIQFGVAGDSGSVVREVGPAGGVGLQPLGIVVEALGPRVARAIRFDEARRWVIAVYADRPDRQRSTAAAASVEMTAFSGRIVGTGCGPLDVIRHPPTCWLVAEPQDAAPVAITVALPNHQAYGGVRIVMRAGDSTGVSVEATPTDPRRTSHFTPLRFCRPDADGVAECSLAPGRGGGFRFAFDGPVVIQSIQILGE